MADIDVERALRSQLRQANTEANRLREANDDMLAALKALYAACEHRANTEGGDFGEIIGPAAEQAAAILARHATPEHYTHQD